MGFGCVFLTYLIFGTLLPRWFNKSLDPMISLVTSGLGVGAANFVLLLISCNAQFNFFTGAAIYGIFYQINQVQIKT